MEGQATEPPRDFICHEGSARLAPKGRHGAWLRDAGGRSQLLPPSDEYPDSNWSSPATGPNVASYSCDHTGPGAIPIGFEMFRLGCAATAMTEACMAARGAPDGSGLLEPATFQAIEMPLEATSRNPAITTRFIVRPSLSLPGGANPPVVPGGVLPG